MESCFRCVFFRLEVALFKKKQYPFAVSNNLMLHASANALSVEQTADVLSNYLLGDQLASEIFIGG